MQSEYDTQTASGGYQASQIQAGWDVYGSDGKEIGDVAEVGPDYFVVEKGFLLTKEIYIPLSAVASISQDRIELNVPSEGIEDRDWSQPPAHDGQLGGYQTTSATDSTTTDQGSAGTDSTDSGEGTLERREERLQVDTERVQTGEVRVGKEVLEEQQSVDVPVSREEVQVSTRQVDRPATGAAFQEEQVSVPVSEERVDVDKEARVVEELDVDKVARQDTERVSDTVRREEFRIEEEGDVSRR